MAAIPALLQGSQENGQKGKPREVRQGQMTEFLGTLRCAACAQGNQRCCIQESDDACLLCASKNGLCIFTRTIVKQGPKAAFSWNDLIESEPSTRRQTSKHPPSPTAQDNAYFVNRFNSEPYRRQSQSNGGHDARPTLLLKPRDHGPEAAKLGLSRESANGGRASPQRQWDTNSDFRPQAFSTMLRPPVLRDVSRTTINYATLEPDQPVHHSPFHGAEKTRVHEVPGSPGSEKDPQDSFEDLPRRKRAKLDVNRRAEVSMVRSVGACLRCRLMKVPCSPSRPCNECQKVALTPKDLRASKLSLLHCIPGHLKDLLPRLFGGATTGLLSKTDGDEVFQKGLTLHGQRFLRNFPSRADDELLDLASSCFDNKRSEINPAKVHDFLDRLDDLYIRHRANASTENYESAVLGICYLMMAIRAFAASFCPRDKKLTPPELDFIQTSNSTLASLFIVAGTAMSDDDCFGVVRRHSALAVESEDDVPDERPLREKHPSTTRTLHERVEGLLFRPYNESPEPSYMTDPNTTVAGDDIETHKEHSRFISELQSRRYRSTPPNTPGTQEATDNRFTSSMPRAEFHGSARMTTSAPEQVSGQDQLQAFAYGLCGPADKHVWKDNQSRTEFYAGLRCKHCDHQAHTTSEAKKHKLRHEKPFKCSITGCTRAEGFTTQNDLDRHRKAIHAVPTSGVIGHRCAAENCPKKDKVWPRADNFRQHCQRLHPDIDTPELMKRSLLSKSSAVLNAACPSPSEIPMVDHDTARVAFSSKTTDPDVSSPTMSPTISRASENQADQRRSQTTRESQFTSGPSPRSTNPSLEDNNIHNKQNGSREDNIRDVKQSADRVQPSPTTPTITHILNSPPQRQEENTTSDVKVEIPRTGDAPLAKIPWDAIPASTKPLSTSSHLFLDQETITYYVHSNCTDRGVHFVRKSREGPKTSASKKPQERFVIIRGSCSVCQEAEESKAQ